MRNKGFICAVVVIVATAALSQSCGTYRKVKTIHEEKVVSTITLPKNRGYVPQEISTAVRKDTISVVDMDGKEMFLMRAIQDEDGNTVANEQLDAAVVTARFRHLAERNGKVKLEFQIIVPESLQDNKWQLRYQPTMFVLDDSLKLDQVFITGKDYRRKQLRGYEQYQRWLNKIITDSTLFVDQRRLEIFIERNLPEVYKFKTDTTIVDDEFFDGLFGVTEREAIDHYTRKFLMKRNSHRVAQKGKMFRKYIKAPIVTEGLRLDTVVNVSGNYVYNYIQELDVTSKSKLKKVDIVLDGTVWEQGECIYDIPRTDPLTFYISSLSAFADGTERYIKKVVERRAQANAYYNIEFATGKADVVPDFRGNASEISLIKAQLTTLLGSEVFDIDSIIVVASASPEGTVAANSALAKRRSESITAYFNKYMMRQIDSLNAERGLEIGLDGEFVRKEKQQPIRFRSRSVAEDWDGLGRLVEADTLMDVTQKEEFRALCEIANLDEREMRMRKEPWYQHMKDDLYPALRSVKFEFNLGRKGMIKDTIQTTVIDSTYMRGVQALRDREYEEAVVLLGPYEDYNAAVAFCAMDRNLSALSILEKLDRNAEVNYMMAIIYSRLGDDQKAVQHYMNACAQNGSYVHRGNLDPEISMLIERYGLNRQDDDLSY